MEEKTIFYNGTQGECSFSTVAPERKAVQLLRIFWYRLMLSEELLELTRLLSS
jgi:hypothetical protein